MTAFIVSGVRTAIGKFGGSLSGHSPTELAAICSAEAVSRSGLPAERIDHAVFGNVIHTEAKDMYLSRVAAIGAGAPVTTPALTLNRLCGSGLQAIMSAADAIERGDATCALAGGAEVMSRAPFANRDLRWGQKLGDIAIQDMLVGALTDPFGHGHMGETAENVAARYGISRQDQDAIALQSQERAALAIKNAHFSDQIVPVEVKLGRKTVLFDTDEFVRPDVSMTDLETLRPAFRKDGSVTAGNASGINDGAAALVLTNSDLSENSGVKPIAGILGHAITGVDPSEMGVGPISATRRLLDKLGMSISDFDVVESNEAFAAQACAVSRELGFSEEQTNPNGGAIALGHPIGATGAILTVKTIYELKRIGGRFGLITMCIGGGQGIAMAVEAIS